MREFDCAGKRICDAIREAVHEAIDRGEHTAFDALAGREMYSNLAAELEHSDPSVARVAFIFDHTGKAETLAVRCRPGTVRVGYAPKLETHRLLLQSRSGDTINIEDSWEREQREKAQGRRCRYDFLPAHAPAQEAQTTPVVVPKTFAGKLAYVQEMVDDGVIPRPTVPDAGAVIRVVDMGYPPGPELICCGKNRWEALREEEAEAELNRMGFYLDVALPDDQTWAIKGALEPYRREMARLGRGQIAGPALNSQGDPAK